MKMLVEIDTVKSRMQDASRALQVHCTYQREIQCWDIFMVNGKVVLCGGLFICAPPILEIGVQNGKFETLSDCKIRVSKFKMETLKKAETQRCKITQK